MAIDLRGRSVSFYDDISLFPTIGSLNVLYVDRGSMQIYAWNGVAYELIDNGGGGGGSTITVVANYNSLPDPTTVTGKFYWCSDSQGTRWLPGSIGGTYYPSGLYYSNGVTWEFMASPYQATQTEVNTGTNDDKFVTPKTFNDSSQLASKVPYAGATSDVDLGTHILNAQSVNVKGTGGNGHVGLKHQSADATASTSETVIFAGSDGEPRYKNDGGAVAQFASRAWVTAQGYITNVITALGYTPENVSNKSDSYTSSSSTTYASTKAVVDGLATKQATLTDTNFGTFSNGLTAKTTPVDADTINISDSADSNKSKKLSFTNLKAFLKTYFDTIYTTTSAVASQITTALSSYVPTTRTINGYDLSANRTLNASDVSAVASNSAITGATKTKITYDSKGLVTSGADATTADIADSTNKRYVTDAQLTVIGNTSGTNTGDETQSSILSKLGFVRKIQKGGTITGTVSETLVHTFSFAANEYPSSTILYIESQFVRTGTPVNTGTIRVKINTSNTLVGSTTIALSSMGGNTYLFSQLRRKFDIESGFIKGLSISTSGNTDLTTTTLVPLSVSIDTTQAWWLFITYQPNNSGDTAIANFSEIKNF